MVSHEALEYQGRYATLAQIASGHFNTLSIEWLEHSEGPAADKPHFREFLNKTSLTTPYFRGRISSPSHASLFYLTASSHQTLSCANRLFFIPFRFIRCRAHRKECFVSKRHIGQTKKRICTRLPRYNKGRALPAVQTTSGARPLL